MPSWIGDLRLGWRTLGRDRGFTAAALACVALGIGASTAMFSVADAILLRPLPFFSPERLVWISDVQRTAAAEPEVVPVSRRNFETWRDENRVFERIAAFQEKSFNLTREGEEPEHLEGARVSADLFPLLGIRPLRGRTFLGKEDRPGNESVALLGHALWQRRFGSDPRVVGGTIELDGRSHTVVGVLPPGFLFPSESEVWVPLALSPDKMPPLWHVLGVVARRKPDVTLEKARAEMAVLASRLERAFPDTNTGWTAEVVPLGEHLVGDLRPRLLALLVAVGFLQAIACADFACLLLARGSAQADELAVRAALGARRSDLIRRLLVEAVLLALLGGLLGMVLGSAGLRPLLALNPDALPAFRTIEPNARAIAFALLATVVTGVLCGLPPALRASRPEIQPLLKEGGRKSAGGRQSRRLLGAFVVFQLSIAMVLLAGAGLLARSLFRLERVDPGFRRDHLLTMRISLPRSTYPEEVQRAAFVREALRRIGALPGVRAAAATSALPIGDRDVGTATWFSVEGHPPASGVDPQAPYRLVTAGYFRTLGIPVLQGRDFTDRDHRQAPPVAIVSAEMARRHWPGESPLGKRIRRGVWGGEKGLEGSPDNPWMTVVGVVGDVRDEGPQAAVPPIWYQPFDQEPARGFTLVIHTAADPVGLIPEVRRAVREVAPVLPLYNIAPIEEVLAEALAQPRFSAVLLGLFSLLGLTLAAVGLYGVMSYSVSQSRREIGIRMALGARMADVLRLFLRRGMILAACGVALGVVGALLLTRLLSGLLYGVPPEDPATFAGIGLMLVTVALAASYLPARRAARMDPLAALRSEGP